MGVLGWGREQLGNGQAENVQVENRKKKGKGQLQRQDNQSPDPGVIWDQKTLGEISGVTHRTEPSKYPRLIPPAWPEINSPGEQEDKSGRTK